MAPARLFADTLVLLRGGGDLATGAVARLVRAGFPVVVLELPRPLVVRRTVAVATAVLQGEITVEDLHARRVDSAATAVRLAREGVVPVLVDPEGATLPHVRPTVLVDARMAKRNLGTHQTDAPLVVALGPGFTASEDCHAVVETARGHFLGRVYWRGQALPDTGTPGLVQGYGRERVLRAPVAGTVQALVEIGDMVQAGQAVALVDGEAVHAPFPGVVRGLIADGTPVPAGLKIGDIDPRGVREHCFTISDKALAVGGGVLEAVLTWLNTQRTAT
ncbi:selenium-dependent molybdenum cofactor biosynthesis protein YqeB [Ardenticatena maritima]|uniref:EF2563 family selenium-dependent molybdenum hydroxylase system protein n=1 Tax=Ardenticatena maritima TaxID=872965 RepID=A0A0P6Y1I0_9CHLR|nr:selenium-dependent molybdenum cofactor biosynthesis protein YqeB [Ardenticatena maritima]KPL86440.1 hypothetical protein SE16_14205 [Ardenticatena maritima]